MADAAAAMAVVADVGLTADRMVTALPQAAVGARAVLSPGMREAGASRKGGALREAGAANPSAGRFQEPIETAYGAREQGGSLFAEGEAIPADAATFLDLVLADGAAAFPVEGALANPLWSWALAGVLGDGAAPSLWQRLGLSPADLAATLRDAPWSTPANETSCRSLRGGCRG